MIWFFYRPIWRVTSIHIDIASCRLTLEERHEHSHLLWCNRSSTLYTICASYIWIKNRLTRKRGKYRGFELSKNCSIPIVLNNILLLILIWSSSNINLRFYRFYKYSCLFNAAWLIPFSFPEMGCISLISAGFWLLFSFFSYSASALWIWIIIIWN